jgi:CheY-like chemotaxis protein
MKPRLLLIEDDAAIRESLKDFLEDEGFCVTPVGHGRAAVDFLEAAADLPRLIFLDLTMPIMNGRQFRAWQLTQTRLRGIPTFVLSAAGNAGREAMDLDAAGFLRKPIDLDVILATLEPFR